VYSNEIFGQCLRRRRRELDLSQEQLAKKAHVSQNLIVRYEKGTVTPGFDKAIALAGALEMSVGELAGLTLAQESAKATADSVS